MPAFFLRRARRAAPSVLVLVTAAVLLAGCEAPSFGFPDAASEQAERVRDLWRGSMSAGVIVAVLVWGLIAWSLVRYRRRSDDVPHQVADNLPIEAVYITIPILIVSVLFFFTVRTDQAIDPGPSDGPDVVVEVEGFQWQWQFTYPDEDVVVIGNSEDEPPEMVLPVDRTIRFELLTADVIHSFWVPRFLTKRDMVPEVDNEIDVDTTTIGTFRGRCAEFCGLDHWRMNFTVRVVPEAEYEAWLAERRDGGS
jgi:cytochrome c oxidase subunit II